MQIQFPANSAALSGLVTASRVKEPTGGAGSGPPVVSEPSAQVNSSQGVSYSVDELQAMVNQMQAQVGSFFTSIGQGDSTGMDFLASSGLGALPDITDPTGDAIDYLLDSTGNGSRAGDIFNLALSANNQGLELAQVQGALAAQAQTAYEEAAALVQRVQDAQQSNYNTLFQLGGGGAAGINALI